MMVSELSSYAYSARVQSKIALLSPQSNLRQFLTLVNNIVKLIT